MERSRASSSRNDDGNVHYSMLDSQQSNVTRGLVCLMVAIALERITFYIVTDNMTNFFVNVVKVNDSSNVIVNTFLVFSGTSFFLPLFGGILGDSLISPYVCTLIGFLIEAVGSVFLLVLSILIVEAPRWVTIELVYGMVFTGLTLMAIGLGFHRANILALGCKQLGQRTDETKNMKAVEKFFRGFYWVTNVGALIADIILSVTESSQGSREPQSNYLLGVVQTVAIFLGALFIIVGNRWYVKTTPNGENLRKLSRTIFRKITFMTRRKRTCNDEFLSSQLSEQRDEDELSTCIFKIILLTSSLIMFGIIYFLETGDIFFKQGLIMNYTVGNKRIPLQVILGFDSFTILVVLPLIHFLITPFLSIPLLKKMGLGLLSGCASALTCGIVETVRLNYWCSSQTVISIFWQVPQFIFLSLAEIFVIISNLQFNYCESPPNMEGLVLGIGFCLLGLGSYMARLVILVVDAAQESWYPTDFNEGEVWKFLFFLAGMQLFFLLIFAWHAYCYRYKYLYKESEGTSVNSPLLRGPGPSEMYDTYTSIGSASIGSLDSLASSESGGH